MSDDCVAGPPFSCRMGGPGGLKDNVGEPRPFNVVSSDARADDWITSNNGRLQLLERGLAQARMWQNEQLVVSIAQKR